LVCFFEIRFNLNDPEQDAPAIIKRYYRWSCVMGLFSGEGDAPEDWEIKALRKAFLNEFPLAGLYQG